MSDAIRIVDRQKSSLLGLFKPKEVIISIILGLAGFLCSSFTLSFNNPPFSVSILWSYLFPLLAGMAYGGRYGLISGVVGLGAFFPFILWPTNGWANLVTAILYIALFIWMGYFGKLRQKRPSLWNSPLLISIPYIVLYFYISYLLYPVAFSSNPPFWEPKAETSIPTTVLTGILTKGVALMYFYIIIDVAILKVPTIRKLLGLEIKRESRVNGKIMLISVLCSLLVWYVLDIFYRIFIYKTFPQGLFQLADAHEFISALVFIFAGFLVGYILSLYMESRIRAEEKMRESEQRYRELAEQIGHLGFWNRDVRSDYLTCSAEACRILGLEPQKSPVDLKILESLIHPDDRAHVFNAFVEKGIRSKSHDIEFRVVRPDGTVRFIRSIGNISDVVDGKPILMSGILLDITDRKQINEALRTSEELYRSLFDNMLNGFAYCKMLYEAGQPQDYIYLAVNPAFEMQTKLKDVNGKKATEVIPGIRESDPQLFEIYGRVALTGIPERLEIYVNALKMWFLVSVYSPQKEYFVAVFDVINERKKSEKALIDSESRYRRLFETAQDAILILDGDSSKIIDANPFIKDMLGFAQEELLGKNLWEIGSFRDIVASKEAFNELQSKGYIRYDNLPLETQDKRRIEVEFVSNKYRVDGKEVIQCNIRDNTDRKRLEYEQQRAAKLESIGTLAGGIAHDFNNILTAILGNISLAKMETKPDSDIYDRLEQAEKASLRATALTKQLLTFSKGGAPIKKLASLSELLKDTAGFALRGSNVKCQFSIADDLWDAEIDEGQISQVVNNLIINARQAMPTGGTIELRAENIILTEQQSLGKILPLPKGKYVRIVFTDHGIGIPEAHMKKIFDPFFTTKHEGSGLGLATSLSIVHNHQGHLSVESKLGKGSTFYVYLPASTKTAVTKKTEEKETIPPVKARILVMDDEETVRVVASRMLKHIGYEDVTVAADGAEAIKLYSQALKDGKPFDAVILDLTIPGGMGGKEAIKKLREIDPEVKAIVSSGYSSGSAIAEYKECGFSSMVDKPYTIEQLRQGMQELLG